MNQTSIQEQLMTVGEAAFYVRTSKAFLKKQCNAGLIPCIKVSNRTLIRKSALETYLNANTKEVVHG